MNIIFLDFDGVIYTNYYKSYEQIEEIKKIIMTEFEKPSAHISADEYINHVINSKLLIF